MGIPIVDGLVKLGGTWLEGKTAKTKAKAEAAESLLPEPVKVEKLEPVITIV